MDNGMGDALDGQSIQLAWGIEMAVQNPPAPPFSPHFPSEKQTLHVKNLKCNTGLQCHVYQRESKLLKAAEELSLLTPYVCFMSNNTSPVAGSPNPWVLK